MKEPSTCFSCINCFNQKPDEVRAIRSLFQDCRTEDWFGQSQNHPHFDSCIAENSTFYPQYKVSNNENGLLFQVKTLSFSMSS